jgi:uncharacterized repeat protein (TIGR01451 family)
MKKKVAAALVCTMLTVTSISFTSVADWDVEDGHKMHWAQLPDLNPTGMDVNMLQTSLADDFRCSRSGPITDIHFWGSFADDNLPEGGAGGLTFLLSIHANTPAGEAESRGIPGDTLWSKRFRPGQYTVRLYHQGPQDWYDPVTGIWLNNSHFRTYQYNFHIDIEEAFWQEEGTIYWLAIKDVPSPDADYAFGWKTTTLDLRWNNAAVYRADPPSTWLPLKYPEGHEYENQSLDLAFVIAGIKETCVEVDKVVWNPIEEKWVESINALVSTNATFKISVHNCGYSDLIHMVITDYLPDGLKYINGSADPQEPTIVDNKLIWEFDRPFEYCEGMCIKFDVQVISAGKNVNQVSVTAESEVGSTSDEDDATIYGVELPSVEIEKKVSDDGGKTWEEEVFVDFGETVRFKITVHNDGEKILYTIIVNDILPYCLKYAGNAKPAEPKISGNILTWTFPSLEPWHIIVIEFDAEAVEEGKNVNNVTVNASSMGFIISDWDTATVYVGGKPTPNLDCEGTLSWSDVKPGSTVMGTIYVKNIGESGSKLDWKISEYPPWGTWTFVPTSGKDLTPEDGPVEITVKVVAPNEKNKIYSGEVKIINEEDNSDYCVIEVSLETPKNKQLTQPMTFVQILHQLLQRFPMLKTLLDSSMGPHLFLLLFFIFYYLQR